jgi:hypothetical protein
MLHLARKAFYPAPPPFPLLHIDTLWKFQAMYAHRTRMVEESGMQHITHTNPEGMAEGVGPFSHGLNYHTDVMKTQALKQALDAHQFDVVFEPYATNRNLGAFILSDKLTYATVGAGMIEFAPAPCREYSLAKLRSESTSARCSKASKTKMSLVDGFVWFREIDNSQCAGKTTARRG